jgi:thioredoxin
MCRKLIHTQLKGQEMATIHLNKEEFLKRIWDFEKSPKEWHFRGERPAIVDFYATWCGPCQMLAPVLEELSDEYAGKIDIYKIDTGEEEELASAFGIRSIPSMMFCPTTGHPQMLLGAMSKTDLEDAMKNILKVKK